MTQVVVQDDYKVQLEVFEGPLDLLLYLIKKLPNSMMGG
jgi:hypothetical protein